VIDNDSGTYRPPVSELAMFQSWLEAPERLGALGRFSSSTRLTMDTRSPRRCARRRRRRRMRGRGKGGCLGLGGRVRV
jgi:hypothetical protein